MTKGTVYWVTGLSGAGKTTIGSLLYERLKKIDSSLLFLDGDTLRMVFGNDLGFTLEDRKKSAFRNSRLCKLLSDQGAGVICATISMFHDVRKWNRDHIDNYKEIFIRVPLEILQRRDQKKLYSSSALNQVSNVAGIDLEVEFPSEPDVVIDNDGTQSPDQIVDQLLKELHNTTRSMMI